MGFHLQTRSEGQNKCTCPNCGRPKCFTYYIDDKGNILNEKVGRCEHINKCGYDYKPKDFFRDNPGREMDWETIYQAQPKREVKPPPPFSPLPLEYVERSFAKHSPFDRLTSYLLDETKTTFQAEQILRSYEMYLIGCTKNRGTIYWQIDINGKVHTGKIVDYDNNAHRIKGDFDRVNWVHSKLRKTGALPLSETDWKLYQCLFGEHLLHYKENQGKHVALVEGEKTAYICSIKYPNMVWVSCGSMNNLKPEFCQALKDRVVHVFPDTNAVDRWRNKIDVLKEKINAKFIYELDWIRFAKNEGEDVADIVLRFELEKANKQTSFLDNNKTIQEPSEDVGTNNQEVQSNIDKAEKANKQTSFLDKDTKNQEPSEDPGLYDEDTQRQIDKAEKALGLTKPHEVLRHLIKTFNCEVV